MWNYITDLLSSLYKLVTDSMLLFVILLVVIIYYYTFKSNCRTYYIDGGNSVDFVNETRRILSTSVIKNDYDIKEVFDKKSADIVLYIKPRVEMLKMRNKPLEMYPGTNKPIYFSWTYQKPKPTIYIDQTNWEQGIEESGLTLDQYRTYVIQHEFLHALGYDHQVCDKRTAPNGVCPIMYQSTRGCPEGFKCGYKITPFDYENKI